MTSGQGEELLACAGIVAHQAVKCRCDGPSAGLLHAAKRHAEVLGLDDDADPARLERFYAEVRIARQVSHPNVCRVYDVAEIRGKQILSMELIDGVTLRDWAPNKTQEQLLQVLFGAGDGIAAAHATGKPVIPRT